MILLYMSNITGFGKIMFFRQKNAMIFPNERFIFSGRIISLPEKINLRSENHFWEMIFTQMGNPISHYSLFVKQTLATQNMQSWTLPVIWVSVHFVVFIKNNCFLCKDIIFHQR